MATTLCTGADRVNRRIADVAAQANEVRSLLRRRPTQAAVVVQTKTAISSRLFLAIFGTMASSAG
jgi:hypothetical protein